MEESRPRRPSEVLRRGYADEEVAAIYALGRLYLENGDIRRAEVIFHGLTEALPDFAPGWLGMSYVFLASRNYDQAIYSARQALRLDPDFVPATLFLVASLLSTRDYNSAGTFLGEVGEKIESGAVEDPALIRFYKGQLARFQTRG